MSGEVGRFEPNHHVHEVYYRILWVAFRHKLAVACMQDFDEHEYDEPMFLLHADGERFCFETEEEAREYLNRHFRRRYIYSDDLLDAAQDTRIDGLGEKLDMMKRGA